jgi:cysteine desulfurase/selenocysteine lyase
MIYLDNAATTYPKPSVVLDNMMATYKQLGVSPGRGGYDRAAQAEEAVDATRHKLARFFGAPRPDRVVFTANATDALNLVIQGLVRPGGHIVASRLEHNSVLRPLHHLHLNGIIEYDLVPFDGKGIIDPEAVAAGIRTHTQAVVICHASNVLGTIQPIWEIGRICRDHGVPLIVDAAQSAGLVPIDMTDGNLTAVAFTGHKSLFGPSGIGGLVLSSELEVRTTRFGGTGIDSGSLVHTRSLPHRLEAGTLNLMGIIGLSEGLDFIATEGRESILRREMALFDRLRVGLSGLGGIDIHAGSDHDRQVGLMTVNVGGMAPADVGAILDADFGIAVRTGLHCAPLVHRDIGTYPRGGVRFSLGPFNTAADIDRTIEAMNAISRSAGMR